MPTDYERFRDESPENAKALRQAEAELAVEEEMLRLKALVTELEAERTDLHRRVETLKSQLHTARNEARQLWMAHEECVDVVEEYVPCTCRPDNEQVCEGCWVTGRVKDSTHRIRKGE